MKITIIVFSPTGNTKKIAETFNRTLTLKKNNVSLIDLTRDTSYFERSNKPEYLESIIPQHDLLIAGAPVYAHHMQYHMKELLENLPLPDGKWGKLVLPFITYGGINSGIALEEAGKILTGRKRTVIGAAKFSLKHHALQNFINKDINAIESFKEIENQINALVSELESVSYNSQDKSRALVYRSRKEYLIDNFIFDEKKWHKSKYPNMYIDQQKCTQCLSCVNNCPVLHLKMQNGAITASDKNECIHCTNCITLCPAKAIIPHGDLEKMKSFMGKLLAKGLEIPAHQIY
ncbi:MAG: EFR1 family ferrodoxin [Spirochaetes bacterium]|nr:EFR1 family ferrodoxin [Spirochaetota bacterium]